MFRRLVRLGSFLPCLRQANVTQIPKGPPSSSVSNYQPISKTSVLSKVFERFLSVRLGRFMERNGVLPTTQFAYRKGLGTCDALLYVSHTVQIGVTRGWSYTRSALELHAVSWSQIGILMRLLAAEPLTTAGLLFPSQCLSGKILLTPYSMVWD